MVVAWSVAARRLVAVAGVARALIWATAVAVVALSAALWPQGTLTGAACTVAGIVAVVVVLVAVPWHATLPLLPWWLWWPGSPVRAALPPT